jgi:hypothetical protein
MIMRGVAGMRGISTEEWVAAALILISICQVLQTCH